jgi:hypothetical protein
MFIQVILQDPVTNIQYHFEVNDRLIRNSEYDGWKEVPVKPNVYPTEADSETQDNGNNELSGPVPLPGKYCWCINI